MTEKLFTGTLNHNQNKNKQIQARGATLDDFSGQFFRIFEISIFCFVVAICDLVHAMDAMYGLP